MTVDATLIRAGREAILADRSRRGRSLTRRLADHADGWLVALGGEMPTGWALAATGGYARGHLYPGGDVDVLLLHPRSASATQIEEVTGRVWYPLWDAGLKLSPATHSDRSLLQLAAHELFTLTSLLEMRCLVGDTESVDGARDAAVALWRKHPWAWLDRLLQANRDRWQASGDVAARLEPNLKDGCGGLRDVDALRWALLIGRADIAAALDAPLDDASAAAATLAAVRAELHRCTGRSSDVLLLQDQDAVAEAGGYADADEMMLAVSAAARDIEWISQRFWERIELSVTTRPRPQRSAARRRPIRLARGVVETAGEVDLASPAGLDDPALVWYAAEAAAANGLRLARSALVQLTNVNVDRAPPWSADMRQAFVGFLGCGSRLIEVADALEHFGLISTMIPEWSAVRSRPQRNAFHVYTVDRHLLQTVVEANRLVRSVRRPDLLLVAALLHDIGKGHPGDHTAVGVELATAITQRMGFSDEDVHTVWLLVDTHLLLAETATRRDLDDPRTAELVAGRVGSLERLELLRALTEADSRATGPSCWTDWKANLVDQLVQRATACLRGTAATTPRPEPSEFVRRLMTNAVGVAVAHERGGDVDTVAVVSPDRPGLFATIAGTLAVHGIEILGADVWTTDEGIAVDQFQVPPGTAIDVARLDQFLGRALDDVVDLDERVAHRLATRSRRRRAQAAAAPRLEVVISNEQSAATTMVEVRSPDAEAVLYRLARVLHDHDLDIVSAKVATLGHEVVDVFYVRRANCPDEPQLPEGEHEPLAKALSAALE